ncbi:hypothetical protein PYV02_08980 [Leifsonia sp. H3M29-4]|uniref:hypothetical protein n=1 Tax=Salinibacterium metalliresistens TaxID=3031321 RepID=UPI0023DB377C|nr:hypothetical protein [Salinibacterium metalliresistens]MDF1479214.1 hypothetical protein [Salinibacterium metalliresistens]
MQYITDTTDACRSSIKVLEPAVRLDGDGSILNVSELEALAEQEGVVQQRSGDFGTC